MRPAVGTAHGGSTCWFPRGAFAESPAVAAQPALSRRLEKERHLPCVRHPASAIPGQLFNWLIWRSSWRWILPAPGARGGGSQQIQAEGGRALGQGSFRSFEGTSLLRWGSTVPAQPGHSSHLPAGHLASHLRSQHCARIPQELSGPIRVFSFLKSQLLVVACYMALGIRCEGSGPVGGNQSEGGRQGRTG